MSTSFELDTVKNYLVGLQSCITGALTDIDGTPFLVDAWQKEPGEKLQGKGVTQILEGGPAVWACRLWFFSCVRAAAAAFGYAASARVGGFGL